MEIINCGEGMHNMEDGYCLDCGLTVDQIDAWDELQADRDALVRLMNEAVLDDYFLQLEPDFEKRWNEVTQKVESDETE